jgi:iron complex outermembrane receptor protein
MIQAAWAEEPPQAQSAPSELEEVVVTAQKTSENIMRVPMAITAVTANELASQHIDNIQDLTASVPNFNFGTYAGTARIAIRGVGFDSINTGAEERVPSLTLLKWKFCVAHKEPFTGVTRPAAR